MGRAHQPGEGKFTAILSEDVDWKPFAAFPPSARLGILVGDPLQAGPYVVRVKLPSGVKLMPHSHPEDRIYTVISGIFYIGLGDRFDADKLVAYPPGAVVVLPGDTYHFHWAKSGEYVTQVTAIGPLGMEYVDAEDDPRHQHKPEVSGTPSSNRLSLPSAAPLLHVIESPNAGDEHGPARSEAFVYRQGAHDRRPRRWCIPYR